MTTKAERCLPTDTATTPTIRVPNEAVKPLKQLEDMIKAGKIKPRPKQHKQPSTYTNYRVIDLRRHWANKREKSAIAAAKEAKQLAKQQRK